MLEYDYYFFYKYLVRNILIYKLVRLQNAYIIPSIKKILFFFSLNNILDVNDVQVYNYLYLFKYFFGRRAFLTKINSLFDLGNEVIAIMFILF
jgi:hypothetical protein